jgi:predicted transcriptional regulator
MRRPVTDIALLAYIGKKNADAVSYSEATKACKSSSSASRALHQLIDEGLIEPKPKLIGVRYVTQYAITSKGKQVSRLALQLTELRETAARMRKSSDSVETASASNTVSSKKADGLGKEPLTKKQIKK